MCEDHIYVIGGLVDRTGVSLHTGQINVAWQLQDVTADDGGFVVGEYISQLQLRSLTLTRPLP